jgi:hypothetical protein
MSAERGSIGEQVGIDTRTVATTAAQAAWIVPASRGRIAPCSSPWAEARVAANITSSNHDDMHAGELETSVLLGATVGTPPTTAHPIVATCPLSASAPTPTPASLANHPRQQEKKDWVPLTTSAPQPERSSACSHRHTTKTCAVAPPVRCAPVRHHGPSSPAATSPTGKSADWRCEDFLYWYQD